MKKIEVAALVLAAVGVYSMFKGRMGTDTDSLIQSWAPLVVAAYLMFGPASK
jgi:hypothetical protein